MALKENCEYCSALEYCLQTIEDNINALWIPDEPKTIRCVYFNDLQNDLKNSVITQLADAMNKGGINYGQTI